MLKVFNHDMHRHYMHFLNSVSISVMLHRNHHIRKFCKPAVRLATHSDDFHSYFFCNSCSTDDILGISACRKRKKHIFRLTQSLHTSYEHIFETEIICSTCQVRRIIDADGRKGPSVASVATCQFLCKMSRITARSTVSA